jgi:uncharacterized RDD family membrane protein YckC
LPKIELNTSQHIPIQYELASLRDRILGFLLDAVLLFGVFIILIIFFPSLFQFSNPLFVFVILPILFFYNLAFETLNRGQSPGKMIMGIQVVRIDGKECTISEYLTRWIMRPVEIYSSMGALAAVLIAGSENRQRLGDMAAGTTVVQVRPALRFSLNHILGIQGLDNYQPRYHGITTFSEQDMLILKNALDRYKAYKNEAHQQVLEQLADKVEERLGIQEHELTTEQFLKRVLTDYVVLTR